MIVQLNDLLNVGCIINIAIWKLLGKISVIFSLFCFIIFFKGKEKLLFTKLKKNDLLSYHLTTIFIFQVDSWIITFFSCCKDKFLKVKYILILKEILKLLISFIF